MREGAMAFRKIEYIPLYSIGLYICLFHVICLFHCKPCLYNLNGLLLMVMLAIRVSHTISTA